MKILVLLIIRQLLYPLLLCEVYYDNDDDKPSWPVLIIDYNWYSMILMIPIVFVMEGDYYGGKQAIAIEESDMCDG